MENFKIKIITPHGIAEGELYSKENPKTFEAVGKSLSIEGEANLWGEEIYFEIPVATQAENTIREMEIGDIAYWPDGSCLCIFFGRTPVSSGDKPVAASGVNRIGKIVKGISLLKEVSDGEEIKIVKA